jgi:hypothetical protein
MKKTGKHKENRKMGAARFPSAPSDIISKTISSMVSGADKKLKSYNLTTREMSVSALHRQVSASLSS